MSDNEEEKEEESKAKQEAAENAALDAVGNIAGPEAKAVTETAKVVKKNWPYIIGFNVLLFAIIFGPLIAILFAACSGGSSIYSLMSGGNFSSDGSTDGTNNGSGGTVNEDCIGKINPNAKKYVAKVNEAAQKFGTDPALMLAQLEAESGFNPNAVSPVGAQGIAQFMPGTWAGVSSSYNIDGNGNGTENPFEAEDGIYAQGAYNAELAKELSKYSLNTTENILAAYNAGPGAVERFHGIPPYEETKNYVKSIMANYRKYKKCLEQLNNNTNTNSSNGVACIKEDKQGDCGYASAAMLIDYYIKKPFTTSELEAKYPKYYWESGMQKEIGSKHQFNSGNYLKDGFDNIKTALSQGKPVLISGRFPPEGKKEHFMVITGYDSSTGEYIVNNPMPKGCSAGMRIKEEFFVNHPYPGSTAGWYTY